jgi:hypothetical protein
MQEGKAKRIPSWLKRIQEGSWEPEILISGIVLFGLFKIYPVLDDFYYFSQMNGSTMSSRGDFNEILDAVLKFANIILIIGFISHILFRSVWAAFIGLSYVYKSGINYKKLNYPKRYLKTIEKSGNYTRQIIKLEKICSMLFALSFLVFMWVLGLGILGCFVALFLTFFKAVLPAYYNEMALVNTILIFLFIVLIDFISLGGLRKLPYFNKIYYPIHRVAGWLTLSFFYRNIFYGIISNHKKWKVSLTLFLFSVLTFMSVLILARNPVEIWRSIELVPYKSNEYRLEEDKYRARVTDGVYHQRMHIDDYIVDKEYVELFIVHTSQYEEDEIIPACDYYQEKEKEGVSYDSLRMACLEAFYGVALDGQLLKDDFIYHRNSVTGQDGLLSVIGIDTLNSGKHRLDLYYGFYDADKDSTSHLISEQIFFYKAN